MVKKLALALGITFLVIGSLVANHQATLQSKQRSSSVFSNRALGASLIYGYLQTIPESLKVATLRQPYITSRHDQDTLLIVAGPIAALSAMEAETIAADIERGMGLYLSIAKRQHLTNSEPLLEQLGITIQEEDNQTYKAQNFETLTLPPGNAAEGLRLNSYSALQWFDCNRDARGRPHHDCFWRTFAHGAGTVTVQLGVPLFANLLMAAPPHSQAFDQLLAEHKQVVFDEYHHLNKEAEWTDLAVDPEFFIPIGGFLLLAFFALFFGRGDALAPPAVHKEKPNLGWPGLTIDLIRRQLATPQARKQALGLMQRAWGRRLEEVNQITTADLTAKPTLATYQRLRTFIQDSQSKRS